MYSKTYRWVAEIGEVAEFVGTDQPARRVYDGLAMLFQRPADDFSNDRVEIAQLEAFFHANP